MQTQSCSTISAGLKQRKKSCRKEVLPSRFYVQLNVILLLVTARTFLRVTNQAIDTQSSEGALQKKLEINKYFS